MKQRGVKKVVEQGFFALDGQYDTILMLMNGVGIVGTLDRMPEFFKQFDKILDAETLKRVAYENGYAVEVVAEGEHYDYLARITRDAYYGFLLLFQQNR